MLKRRLTWNSVWYAEADVIGDLLRAGLSRSLLRLLFAENAESLHVWPEIISIQEFGEHSYQTDRCLFNAWQSPNRLTLRVSDSSLDFA